MQGFLTGIFPGVTTPIYLGISVSDEVVHQLGRTVPLYGPFVHGLPEHMFIDPLQIDLQQLYDVITAAGGRVWVTERVATIESKVLSPDGTLLSITPT